MSRSRNQRACGRGCWVCGDKSETRVNRYEDALRADEREDPNPAATMHADEREARADEPARLSPRCDREVCARWRPCAPCEVELEHEAITAFAYTPDEQFLDAKIVLSAEEFDVLTELIENPRPPSPELVALFRKVR